MAKADFKPTAKKCRGEAHWFPARTGVFGPTALSGEKFDTPGQAKAAAKKMLAPTPQEPPDA
jgi:hypothetical protein